MKEQCNLCIIFLSHYIITLTSCDWYPRPLKIIVIFDFCFFKAFFIFSFKVSDTGHYWEYSRTIQFWTYAICLKTGYNVDVNTFLNYKDFFLKIDNVLFTLTSLPSSSFHLTSKIFLIPFFSSTSDSSSAPTSGTISSAGIIHKLKESN